MKIKTSELEGAALDWAVSQIEGVRMRFNAPAGYWVDADDPNATWYSPSEDWSRGGQIIESEEIYLSPPCMVQDGLWQAQCWMPYAESFAPTPLMAAMRAIVAAKLGDTVDVPDELL